MTKVVTRPTLEPSFILKNNEIRLSSKKRDGMTKGVTRPILEPTFILKNNEIRLSSKKTKLENYIGWIFSYGL